MPNVQIINNITIPGSTSLFTVVFPPYWQDAPATRYPVLLSSRGYATDNNWIYRTQRDLRKVKWVADSVDVGNGLIAVFSTGGGRESLGINSNALDDLEAFLEYTKAFPVTEGSSETYDLGLDTDKIVTDGGSKAGGTALVWGANPNNANYNVLAIHAYVPPLKLGSTVGLSFFTFPQLAPAVNKAMGSTTAYQYDYKDDATGHILTPEEKAILVGKTFTGENTISGIDNKSAYGYLSRTDLIPALQDKKITISEGTHDAYFPMPYFLEFDKMLKDNGVNHATFIGYVYGHNYGVAKAGDPPWDEDTWEAYVTLVDLASGQAIQPYSASQRYFHIPQQMSYDAQSGRTIFSPEEVFINYATLVQMNQLRPGYFPQGHNNHKLLLSATIPAKVVATCPATITLVGENGKTWRLWARMEEGYYPVYEASGIFGQGNKTVAPDQLEFGHEWTILHFNVDEYFVPGRYEWFFEYDGKEVPNRFTPVMMEGNKPAKAVTEVLSYEHKHDPWQTFFHDNGHTNYSFGVDQYHPLLLESNAAPVVSPISDKVLRVGEELAFTISATDSDGDNLVYDIRDQFGNILCHVSKKVHFNGLSGDFSLLLDDSGFVGTHHLKAIAKDGKGGVGVEEFTVTVQP